MSASTSTNYETAAYGVVHERTIIEFDMPFLQASEDGLCHIDIVSVGLEPRMR